MRKIFLLTLMIIVVCRGYTQQNIIAGEDTTENKVTPKGAMLRSLAIPGWGQLCNGKEIKAAFFAVTEGLILYAYFYCHNEKKRYSKLLKDAEDGDNPAMKDFYAARKEYYMEKRNEFGWYMVLAVILCITDAYVDAYLKNFNEKMEISFYSDYDKLLLSLKLPIN